MTSNVKFQNAHCICTRGRRLALVALILIGAAGLWPGQAMAEDRVVELIRLKMNELGAMQAILEAKASQAVSVRQSLEGQKAELVAEIRDRVARRGWRTLADAQADARIGANIRLIGQAEAYCNQLREKIHRFDANREKLAELLRRIEDDLMMLSQIKGLAVDQLVIQIDQALGRCQSDTEGLLVDATLSPGANTEAILQAALSSGA